MSPVEAAIIYTLEPVFAAIFSVMLAKDFLTWKLALGGGLIIAAMTLSALRSNRSAAWEKG